MHFDLFLLGGVIICGWGNLSVPCISMHFKNCSRADSSDLKMM